MRLFSTKTQNRNHFHHTKSKTAEAATNDDDVGVLSFIPPTLNSTVVVLSSKQYRLQ
jgi:hypothetical protein